MFCALSVSLSLPLSVSLSLRLFLLRSVSLSFPPPGCISRYSAGSVYYYPSYHHQHTPAQVECFQKDLKRYLTRKIGFEAVMRIRCTKGPDNDLNDVL